MYLQKVISRKNLEEKKFFVGVLKVKDEMEGSRAKSVGHRHGSTDPDPY
jgi:hypothetical protein